ncbi:CG17744 [Drosophila busckii]|uniref:CG17744 n=1 Tax=Drosophila busckii TaxID=30019 RepID=A0A0M4EJG2_DROBS|nr:uncharacterized protein LOC108600009 [Drosophila busckii]ALC45077.1 CG17744 [Drosophila busckii]
MAAIKMQAVGSKPRATLTVNADVRRLIGELLVPRIERLQKILCTRMLAEPQQEANTGDWWPDYSLYSQLHKMTDMHGLYYLTQSVLKGLPDELQAIVCKLRDFMHQRELKLQLHGRYRLAQSLIKDLINYINCCNRMCSKQLQQRRLHCERAESKDTQARVCLKIFDERCFLQLHKRMSSLKHFLLNICDLFEVEQLPLLPALEPVESMLVEPTPIRT